MSRIGKEQILYDLCIVFVLNTLNLYYHPGTYPTYVVIRHLHCLYPKKAPIFSIVFHMC